METLSAWGAAMRRARRSKAKSKVLRGSSRETAGGRQFAHLLGNTARTAAGPSVDAEAGFLAEHFAEFCGFIRQAATEYGGTLVTRNGERIGGDQEAGAD
jgi:hypothetical protein